MPYEAVGLGNAIMDALVRIEDDSVLAELGLVRGQMHPVDHRRWHEVYEKVRPLGVEVHSGGSCANALSALALLGAEVLYCGQVGQDAFGDAYERSMRDTCGTHQLRRTTEHVTGKCLSLISARDGERTMLTDLGAAIQLSGLDGFDDRIREAKLFHITGYKFLGGPVRDAAVEALRVAREAGVPISLDVADPFVARHLTAEMVRVLQEYVDIAFLNEEEAEAVTGLPAEEAAVKLGEWCRIAVVKLGGRGSLVRHDGYTYRIPAFKVDVVDTTGAGDAYAGAFLFGWLRGWPADKCGELGSRVAALTVGQVGAVCRDRDAVARARAMVENVR